MKLITSKTCGLCKFIEKKLSYKNINYQHIDVDDDEAKIFFEKNNISSLPILIVDECNFYVGTSAIEYLNKNI